MQELEKILEEIREYENHVCNEVKIVGYIAGAKRVIRGVEEIIRKHMNNGWIPVEEDLPPEPPEYVDDEDDLKEYIVMIDGAEIPTILKYAGDGDLVGRWDILPGYCLAPSSRAIPPRKGAITMTNREVYERDYEELEQYREIGTVEECREAVEKQKPKKPRILSSRGGKGGKYCVCPRCNGVTGKYISYCRSCGQAIQWNENLEGMEDE